MPVLFLHGLGGSRIAWGAQLRALSDQFRCIAWEMPGYGESDPIVPLTFDAIAERVVDLLDALDIESVDLVGLSFGGMHALHVALRFPSRIRRIVLADTSPAFGIDGTDRDDWIRSRLAPIEAGGVPADGAEYVVDLITVAELSPEIRAETVGSFGRIDAAGFRAAVECLADHDVRSELHRIEHRALVVVGELDQETPPSYSRMLHDGLVNSRLEIIDGVGHLSPAEAPDRFNDLVRAFLAEPSAAS